MYKVYYYGAYCAMFDNRDRALEFIKIAVEHDGDSYGDFEILDESDEQ